MVGVGDCDCLARSGGVGWFVGLGVGYSGDHSSRVQRMNGGDRIGMDRSSCRPDAAGTFNCSFVRAIFGGNAVVMTGMGGLAGVRRDFVCVGIDGQSGRVPLCVGAASASDTIR